MRREKDEIEGGDQPIRSDNVEGSVAKTHRDVRCFTILR